MEKLINIEMFIKIFEQENYREKLDKIVLNFFGLDSTKCLIEKDIKKEDIILEFYVCVYKQVIFKIIVKDTKHLFKNSKKFYINFSEEDKNQNYMLLYPCYWEFYCSSCLNNKNHKKQLSNIASLFAATNKKEIKSILKALKVFNNNEINDIMYMLEE